MGLLASAMSIVEELAPEWGARRAVARSAGRLLNYGRHGASTTKKSLRGWITTTGGPDEDITDNVEKLRERSRDLCMGEGLAIGALKTIRTNEIGAGLRLNAQVDTALLGLSPEDADAWENTVEREFGLWAESKQCDAARRSTFGELQALARLSQLMSGDVFALLPAVPRAGDRYDLRVQLIEADRCTQPRMVPRGVDVLGGVEVGNYGEPIAFHFAKRHPGDTDRHLRLVPDTTERVLAFGPETGRPLVLHLMESERPGQRRGVPLLAPVIEKLKQLSRYSEAEIMAAVVSGFFTVAITTPAPTVPIGSAINEDEKVAPDDANAIEMGNGAVVGLAPGEQVTPINPTRPSNAFDGFVKAILLQIGVGLGIPYHVLVMQFDGSYNTSRAALLEFWKRVNVGRTWLTHNFCQPIYETWLEEAILRGYVRAPGFFDDAIVRAAWCGAEWIGPTQGQLDPTKEVEAAKSRVDSGFSTRTRETRELTGGDWWANNKLRGREEQARADAGLSGAKPALVITPTDVASIATVDEGRASVGLPPATEASVGLRWIIEHTQELAPDAAPQPEFGGQP